VDVADWEISDRVLQIWAIRISRLVSGRWTPAWVGEPAVAPGRFAEQMAALPSCVAPRRRITTIR
jgi:hypothetical protein